MRRVLAADRLVDDLLRQIERGIEKRKRQQGDDDQIDLLGQAVAQYEAVDRGLQGVVAVEPEPGPNARGKAAPARI